MTGLLSFSGDVLLFFKFYDPPTKSISYCGHHYVSISEKFCKFTEEMFCIQSACYLRYKSRTLFEECVGVGVLQQISFRCYVDERACRWTRHYSSLRSVCLIGGLLPLMLFSSSWIELHLVLVLLFDFCPCAV